MSTWKAISQTVAMKKFFMPQHLTITSIIFGLLSIFILIIKYFFNEKKYSIYIPNMSIFGPGFTLPQACYSTAMVIRAIFPYFGRKESRNMGTLFIFSYS